MFNDVVDGGKGQGLDLNSFFKPMAVRNTPFCLQYARWRPLALANKLSDAEMTLDFALRRPRHDITRLCRTRPLSLAQISAEKSVSDQLAFLATASQARDNGRFVDNLGNTMAW